MKINLKYTCRPPGEQLWMNNAGRGHFGFEEEMHAPRTPSCAKNARKFSTTSLIFYSLGGLASLGVLGACNCTKSRD
jgi:hypothetical protein